MKLPVNIANKLLLIMKEGATVPSSSMQHVVVQKMIDDGVLQKIHTGRTKASLFVRDAPALKIYLQNHFSITDLSGYVDKLSSGDLLRSEAIAISGNSKLVATRTFKGFLVNSFSPVAATINTEPLIISPTAGSFTFIYDYESFVPDKDVTMVGIENAENFRYVDRQQYLFKNIQPLFVSRYPHSYDLVKWLQKIPNSYIHFGDFDFAGINIYLNEFKKHLGGKSSFLVPGNVEALLTNFGNRILYNKQLDRAPAVDDQESGIVDLMNLFHKYKKVLEQEVFIRSSS
jgi:hypothetical protein